MAEHFSFPLQFEIDVHDMIALRSAHPGVGIAPDGEWVSLVDFDGNAEVSIAVLQIIHSALEELGPRYGFRMVGGSTQIEGE